MVGEDEVTDTEDAGGDTGTDDNVDDGNTTDYTQAGGEDATGGDAEGGDDTETDDAGADAGTDDTTDGTGDDENADDGTDDGKDLKSLEKTLFADLSPEQMSIKNSELMQNYMDLYETLNHIFDNINKIPKDYNNTRVLAFITDKVLDLKDMVHSIITVSYSTKTYVENLTVYKQCLLILKQIDNMLKGLIDSKHKENA